MFVIALDCLCVCYGNVSFLYIKIEGLKGSKTLPGSGEICFIFYLQKERPGEPGNNVLYKI